MFVLASSVASSHMFIINQEFIKSSDFQDSILGDQANFLGCNEMLHQNKKERNKEAYFTM